MYRGTREYFDGSTLGELRSRLFAAPQPGDIGIAAHAYWQAADQLDNVVGEVTAAVNRTTESRAGAAADAARAFAHRIAAHGSAAVREADAAHQAVLATSQHYQFARSNMPTGGWDQPPTGFWEVAGSTAWGALVPTQSYPAQLAAYSEARKRAIDVMNGYQNNSNTTISGEFRLFSDIPPTPGDQATATQRPVGGVGGASGAGAGGGGGVGVHTANVGPAAPIPADQPSTPRPALEPPGPNPGPIGQGGFVPAPSPAMRPAPPRGQANQSANRPGNVSNPYRIPGDRGSPAGPGGLGRVGNEPLPQRPPPQGSGTGPATAPGGGPGRGPTTGSPVQSAVPYAPLGGATGRQDQERRRPSWLVQDDPEEFWLGDLPAHVPPVIGGSKNPIGGSPPYLIGGSPPESED